MMLGAENRGEWQWVKRFRGATYITVAVVATFSCFAVGMSGPGVHVEYVNVTGSQDPELGEVSMNVQSKFFEYTGMHLYATVASRLMKRGSRRSEVFDIRIIESRLSASLLDQRLGYGSATVLNPVTGGLDVFLGPTCALVDSLSHFVSGERKRILTNAFLLAWSEFLIADLEGAPEKVGCGEKDPSTMCEVDLRAFVRFCANPTMVNTK